MGHDPGHDTGQGRSASWKTLGFSHRCRSSLATPDGDGGRASGPRELTCRLSRRERPSAGGPVVTVAGGPELRLHVKARLAGFMVPTHIWFRSEPLPRNPQGKVLKRELHDEFVARAD